MAKRKQNKTINKISKIIYIILLFISIITMGIFLFLKIIPAKYIIPIFLIYIVILLIIGVLIFPKKIKSGIKVFMA